MELTELEQMLKSFDKKMEENTRLNRDVVRKILVEKPKKRLGREKLEAVFYILSPFILALIVVVSDIQFQRNTAFYIGLALFIGIYAVVYIWDIKYFLLVRKINFSDAVLSIKKEIIKLEKYKVRKTRIRYIFMPIAIGGIFLMFFQKPILTPVFIGMLILISLVFVFSSYRRWTTIREQFENLNREIEELESLEK